MKLEGFCPCSLLVTTDHLSLSFLKHWCSTNISFKRSNSACINICIHFLGLPIQNYCKLGDLTQLKFILTFLKARSLKPGCQQIMLFPSFFHAPSSLWLPTILGIPWLLVVYLWSLLLSSHGLLPCVSLITTRVIGLRAHPNQLCLQWAYFQMRSQFEVLGQTWILGNTVHLHYTSQLNAASRMESYWIVKILSFT